MRWKLFFCFACVYGAYHYYSTKEISQPPGELAQDAPIQDAVGIGNAAFVTKNYHLTPLASFKIRARVLSTHHYQFGREAELVPVDLALGWGAMSDTAILDRLRISQGERRYYYRWGDEGPPIPAQEIVSNSANMHMIPANGTVKDQLESVRTGEIINVNGYLVRADAPDGWRWISSLTRTDSGDGACELIWVKSLSITMK